MVCEGIFKGIKWIVSLPIRLLCDGGRDVRVVKWLMLKDVLCLKGIIGRGRLVACVLEREALEVRGLPLPCACVGG